MRRTICVLIGLLLCHSAGCGGGNSVPTANAKAGPTGGTMFPLPKEQGFVEVKSEVNAPDRKARGARRSSTIVATFYQPDGTTPMSPLPSDVSVKLGSADASTSVTLSPSPAESRSPSRFATAPGEYPDAPRGAVLATINGEQVEVPFAAR